VPCSGHIFLAETGRMSDAPRSTHPPHISPHRSTRARSLRRGGSAVAAGALLAGIVLPASSASAVTSTTATNGAVWQIHDAAPPGLDTGSVRTVSQSRVDGFGNIFVRVAGADDRFNGEMMRGFGLTATADGAEYLTTQSVGLGGLEITRDIAMGSTDSTARYFDTFTNTTGAPLTVDVSFGGSLGYGTTTNQGLVRATSDGDTALAPTDAWALIANTQATQRPVGVVLGSPAPFAGAMTRTGNQQRSPFENPVATSGNEANFYGFINTVTVQPGETKSLARFVHVGAAGPDTTTSQAQATTSLQSLAVTPNFAGLTNDELCTVTNWDLTTVSGFDATTCAATTRLTVPASPAEVDPITTSRYDVVNKTMVEMQADMTAGRTTSAAIVQAYLDRINVYDGGQFGFNAFLHVASDALTQAKAADAARAAGATGDLLGIPIALKDLYDTKDQPTTGGTRALDGWQPDSDAYQVEKLRAAGAVLIGKTNLSEFANSGSNSESGWGQVWNGLYGSKTSFGSSGGSAVAVATSMAAGAMGTQTGVSLYAPTTGASLTTFRGTDGMASTRGVMPLTWGQDYAGPIARTVSDLAVLLNATTGTDPLDELTVDADAHKPADWKTSLDASSLQGKRIGYLPSSFVSTFADDGTGEAALARLADLRAAGATVVEMPAAPSGGRNPAQNVSQEGWARYIEEQTGFPYADGNALLASPEVLPYNKRTSASTAPRMTPQNVDEYIEYRTNYKTIIDAWMAAEGVDAVVYPGFISDMFNNDASSSQLSSDRATGVLTSTVGLPTVVVPVGLNPHGYSMSMQLVGPSWSDATVLGMGYALEQQTRAQVVSTLAPALAIDPSAPVTPPVTPPVDPGTPGDPGAPADPSAPVEPEPAGTAVPVPDASDNTGAKPRAPLAGTGSDAVPWTLLAGALALGGAALTLIRRRRFASE
jgi:amidase